MSEITIEVQQRSETGTNANRRLRASGNVPAVVYGGDRDAVSIQVDQKSIRELFVRAGGEHGVFLLKLAGTKQARHTMIREVVVDPISRQITHIDFQRVLMTEKVKVPVRIELVGLSEGVKNQAGVLEFVTREVEVECLPGDIPALIELDVTSLEVGDHFEAKDLTIPEKVDLLEELDKMIVLVAHSRVAASMEEVDAEEDALIEADSEEPELITRGKGDEEEDAGA